MTGSPLPPTPPPRRVVVLHRHPQARRARSRHEEYSCRVEDSQGLLAYRDPPGYTSATADGQHLHINLHRPNGPGEGYRSEQIDRLPRTVRGLSVRSYAAPPGVGAHIPANRQVGRRVRILRCPPRRNGALDVGAEGRLYVGRRVEKPLQTDAVHRSGQESDFDLDLGVCH